MKSLIIKLCETIILRLDSSYTFPEYRLNYKKAVEIILSQSETGRKAFFTTLFIRMDRVAREALAYRLLEMNKPFTFSTSNEHKQTPKGS